MFWTNSFVENIFYLDLFKRPILLYYRGFKFYPTYLGLLLSLAIYGFLTHGFFISDMFTKKNPILFEQNLVTPSRPEIILRSQLPVYVSNSEGECFIEPTIFSVGALVKDYTTDITQGNGRTLIRREEKKLRPCQSKDFGDPNFVFRLGLTKAYCMENSTVSAKGYWDEVNTRFTYFFLQRCVNGTENVVCKSDDEIDKFLEDKHFGIGLPNTFYDMQDLQEPVKKTWRSEYQLLDPNMMKRMKIFIKQIEFVDDRNYVFDSTENKLSTFAYDYTEFDFIARFRSPILYEILIHSSSKVQKTSRSYQKVPELLARIGGQANALMLIGILLTSVKNFLEMNLQIMNSLYKFPQIEDGRKRKTSPCKAEGEETNFMSAIVSVSQALNSAKAKKAPDKETTPTKRKDDNSNSSSSRPISEQNSFAERVQIQAKEISSNQVGKNKPNGKETMFVRIEGPGDSVQHRSTAKESKGLQKLSSASSKDSYYFGFGLGGLLKLYFFRCFKRKLSKKQALYLKAENQYLEELDVVNILRRLQELEKLKLILLTSEQLALFRLLDKPMIYSDGEEEKKEVRSMSQYKMSTSLRINDKNEDFYAAVSYFNKIQTDGVKSGIDERLLFYLEERMREINK